MPAGSNVSLASVYLVDAFGHIACGLPAENATVAARPIGNNMTVVPASVIGATYTFNAANDYVVVFLGVVFDAPNAYVWCDD